MNWDRIQGDRKQFKGQVKQRWGKLTHDDLDILDGRREQLPSRRIVRAPPCMKRATAASSSIERSRR